MEFFNIKLVKQKNFFYFIYLKKVTLRTLLKGFSFFYFLIEVNCF